MKIYFVDDKHNGVAWIDEKLNYVSTSIDNPVVKSFLENGGTIEPHNPENPLVLQWEKLMETN